MSIERIQRFYNRFLMIEKSLWRKDQVAVDKNADRAQLATVPGIVGFRSTTQVVLLQISSLKKDIALKRLKELNLLVEPPTENTAETPTDTPKTAIDHA